MQSEPTDLELIKVSDHRTRRKILRCMQGKGRISPVELSELIAESLSDTGFHTRVLSDRRAILPTGERQVRGSNQQLLQDQPHAAVGARCSSVNQEGG